MGISINSVTQAAGTYQSTNVSSHQQHQTKQVIKEASPENTYDAVSGQGDTLTISETGKSASMNLSNENSAESQSESSTENLSNYTQTQLKQMYLDGTITKSEYDEELTSREE